MTILDDRAAKAIQEAMDARVRALSVKSATTHMAEVIEIDSDGVTWVHIFGGADRTPAIRTLAKVKKGDLVTVTIEEGVVTINGSSSSPAASVEYVEAADYQIASYAKEAIAGILGDVIQVKNAIIEKASIEDLLAVNATIDVLTADYANLNALVAGKANITDLEAGYAKIDAANINSAAIQDAWIEKLLVQTSLLAKEGTIFKLDAIQADAASITTGTLDVRRLIITREEIDPDTGELVDQKYLVEIDPETSQPTYQKLDGNIIEPRTIGADKILANSITANEITVQNLVGAGGWINLHEGTFFYYNAQTDNGITWDGQQLSIAGQVKIGNSFRSLADIAEKASLEVRIESSSGTSFVNGQGLTVLTAKVFQYSDTELDAAGTAFTYQWYLDDTAISGATSKTYTATAPLTTATYDCEVTL